MINITDKLNINDIIGDNMNIQRYNKFIVATIAGVVAVLNSLYGSGNETATIIIAIATALGVYAVPNKEQ